MYQLSFLEVYFLFIVLSPYTLTSSDGDSRFWLLLEPPAFLRWTCIPLRRRPGRCCLLVWAGPRSSGLTPIGLAWALGPLGSALNFCVRSLKKTQKSFIRKPQMVGGRARCGRTAKGCEVSFWGRWKRSGVKSWWWLHSPVKILKPSELCTLKRWIAWFVDYAAKPNQTRPPTTNHSVKQERFWEVN